MSLPANSPIDDKSRREMLQPEISSVEISGIGGTIKNRPEDFVVDEVPAYSADGIRDRHLFVQIRKRELSTLDAVRRLTDCCGLRPADVGLAGRKDAQAITTQWLSLPVSAEPLLAKFADPLIEVLEVRYHSQKLRRGHLKGNRFEIVMRDLACSAWQAKDRVEAKVQALKARGGLENLYGPQRFGLDGVNLEAGMAALRGQPLRKRDLFVASAAQSGLFNLYVSLRRQQGWLRQVLPGDVLQRTDSGGLFVVEDAAVEQERLLRGELVVSGPMFGAKMRGPAENSASAALETEILSRARVLPEHLLNHGRRLPGSRRPCLVDVGEVDIEVAEACEGLAEGLRLRFTLPSGTYATQFLRELSGGARTGAVS